MKTAPLIAATCFAMTSVATLVTSVYAAASAGTVANEAATYRMQDKQRHRAQADEIRIQKEIIESERNSPEYRAAAKAVRDNYAAYDAKRQETISKLRATNKEFASLANSIEQNQAQIDALREAGGSYDAFQDLYKTKADLKKQAKKVGMDTFVADGGADLYKRWQDSSAYLQDMNINIQVKAGNDEGVKAAQAKARELQESMDQTLVNLATAKANLREERREEDREFYLNNQSSSWWGSHPPYYDD